MFGNNPFDNGPTREDEEAFARDMASLTADEMYEARRAAYAAQECSPGCPHQDCGLRMFEEVEQAGGMHQEVLLIVMGLIPASIVQRMVDNVRAKAAEKRGETVQDEDRPKGWADIGIEAPEGFEDN